MNRFASGALLLLFAVVLTGCASENKGKIEGTKWSNNAGKVKDQQIPADVITLEFSKDGKLKYGVAGMMLTGTYSLGMSDIVTLNMDKELAGSKTHAERIKISGDTLTMTDSDKTTITFHKVKN